VERTSGALILYLQDQTNLGGGINLPPLVRGGYPGGGERYMHAVEMHRMVDVHAQFVPAVAFPGHSVLWLLGGVYCEIIFTVALKQLVLPCYRILVPRQLRGIQFSASLTWGK